MPIVIQNLFQSKKFVFTLFATVAVLLGGKYGVTDEKTVQTILTILWPTYLASQGIADIGAKKADGFLAETKLRAVSSKEMFANVMPLANQLFVGLEQLNQSYRAAANAYASMHHGAAPVPSVTSDDFAFFRNMSESDFKTLFDATTDIERKASLQRLWTCFKNTPPTPGK